jgi:hypothetical protein
VLCITAKTGVACLMLAVCQSVAVARQNNSNRSGTVWPAAIGGGVRQITMVQRGVTGPRLMAAAQAEPRLR